MKIICYLNKNGENMYELLPQEQANPLTIVREWSKSHPYCTVKHIFSDTHDELKMVNDQYRSFYKNHDAVGLNENDLGARIQAVDGAIYKLAGVNTRKTKYKITWLNEQKGTYLRSTVDWAQHMLANRRVEED